MVVKEMEVKVAAAAAAAASENEKKEANVVIVNVESEEENPKAGPSKKRPRPSSSDSTTGMQEQQQQQERRVSSRIAATNQKKKLELEQQQQQLQRQQQQQQQQQQKQRSVQKRVVKRVINHNDVVDVQQPQPQPQPNNNSTTHTAPSPSEVNGGDLECTSAIVDVGVEKSDHARVKDTLRLFNKHYLQLVQEEENRCNRVQPVGNSPQDSKSKKVQKGKGKQKLEDGTRKTAKRPDLKAISKMMESNAILYRRKRIGALPGIDVGHQFYSRAEMVVVGIHSHWLNGIDFMGQSYQKDYPDHKLPLAVAIVLSGIYEDDLDNAENVVYTGQGGNDLLGNKRQIGHQKMERGNLALKNSMEHNLPVRVIRGHKCPSSYCGKVYTYDGLYMVHEYWAEKGLSDFTVFKFRLKRVEGQPVLTTNQVQYINGRVPRSIEEIRGLVCKDISGGQEPIPIPATNLVDDPPIPPTGFKYTRYMKVSSNIMLPANAIGCNCNGKCIEPRSCACARLNGSDFPYVNHDGGRLIEAKDIIYECGPNCGCAPDCVNRTSQKGIRYRFEVYRTPMKGWAVRSWDFIRSGALVCEYIGVLQKSEDVEGASENYYIFDIDCMQTMNGLDGRQRRSKDAVVEKQQSNDRHCDSETEYCIDACSIGNLARFFNHSCEPNLFVQCVLSAHRDVKLARILLFAADNIPPLQELTYDYGYPIDSVLGPDGKPKQMACYCGASDCRKRLF